MKKKIVLISGCFYGQVVGGTEYQLFLIGNYLKNLNNEVFYIFIDNGNPIKYENYFKLIKIKKKELLRKLFGSYFFFDSFNVYKNLKKFSPDIILIRSGFSYVGIASKYCSNHKCALIWYIASKKDIEPFKFRFNRSIIFEYIDKKFIEYGIRNSTYIVAQAKYQDEILYSNYGRRCDLVIPNFHPLPERKIVKNFPIKIIWIANFNVWKQPHIFIELAKKFKNYKDIKFIMIGRLGASNWQNKILSSIHQSENIQYMGELTINEVNKILSNSHIFVNTSKLEGFPNTFIQAWMRKVPVVSLNVDPDDIIKKNKIGFFSGSFDQMLKDIKLLIHNDKLREEMGARAQNYAFKNFSLNNIEKIVNLIREKT